MCIMLEMGSCCLRRDRAGQLGEGGEYWMGRSESGSHDIQSSEDGSARLCRLRTMSVLPPATSFEFCTDAYGH
jgi:hypothetical protein